MMRNIPGIQASADSGTVDRLPLLLALVMLAMPLTVTAEPLQEFEIPPTLPLRELVKERLPAIPGISVENKVPTDGLMGTFTLRADKAEFGDEAGTYTVRGRELFEIRMSEIPAIVELRKVSKTKTFAQALGRTAVGGFESVAKVITSPKEALEGVPSGVERLFGRVKTGVKRMKQVMEDSKSSGTEKVAEAAKVAGRATRDAMGYEQERRTLARTLGVDPYTTNLILAQKLDDLAWVSFAGRLGVNSAVRKAMPGGAVVTGARITQNLVWDTPKGDLIVRVEEKLEKLGVSREGIAAFMHNKAVPLSLQVAVVEELERLDGVAGRELVVEEMGEVMNECQARFLATSLRMLAEYHRKNPLVSVTPDGPLLALDRIGHLIVPAPVDYLSWTENVARFAKSAGGSEEKERRVWMRGGISPLARKGLESEGWTISVGEFP